MQTLVVGIPSSDSNSSVASAKLTFFGDPAAFFLQQDSTWPLIKQCLQVLDNAGQVSGSLQTFFGFPHLKQVTAGGVLAEVLGEVAEWLAEPAVGLVGAP
jgi:hypothetical protein